MPDTSLSIEDAGPTAGGKQPRTTSLLAKCVLEEFEGVPVEPVLRKYWSEGAGKLHQILYIHDDTYSAL